MTVIENYIIDHNAGPRPCEYSSTTEHSLEPPCDAELILHDGQAERFLCKFHAANELGQNPSLLAKAVIELHLLLARTPVELHQ